jgi:membrane protease YdiL (CAAX protease family)
MPSHHGAVAHLPGMPSAVLRHDPRRAITALAAVLLTLGAVKAGTMAMGLPGAAVGVLATVGVVAIVRLAHGTSHDLGLSRHTVRVGAMWAAGLVTLIAVGYLVAALGAQVLPAVASWMDGFTLAGEPSDAATALRHALVTIPLGTVLIEEVAFRGAIPALFLRAGMSARTAIVAASVIFGLWHVPAALEVAAGASSGPPVALLVGLTLVFTTLAGLLLGWLRHRTGSLLPPIGVHLATNSLGIALVWYLSLGS